MTYEDFLALQTFAVMGFVFVVALIYSVIELHLHPERYAPKKRLRHTGDKRHRGKIDEETENEVDDEEPTLKGMEEQEEESEYPFVT